MPIIHFEKAAGRKDGKHEGTSCNDADVYQIMEGAAYALQVHPDPKLREHLGRQIGAVGAAPWEDGYLFTFYSVPEGARPKPADTLTYLSKTTASFVHIALDATKDQNVPTDAADSSNLQLDFWPHSGTTEWIQFEWDKRHELSRVRVYWFDDTGRGACHLPKAWLGLACIATALVNSSGSFDDAYEPWQEDGVRNIHLPHLPAPAAF